MMSSFAGLLPRGDPDLGVPVGQIFSPMYLFNQDGSPARRPVIRNAPDRVRYEHHFDLEIMGRASEVGSVALLRSDHNTHSLTAGDRDVKREGGAVQVDSVSPKRGQTRTVVERITH